MLRDVATDQQIAGTTATLSDRPRRGRALQHPAAADRRHIVRRVRPAPDHAVLPQVNSYYVILEVPPDLRAIWRRCTSSTCSRRTVRPCRCPAACNRHRTGAPAGRQPPEPVPGGDDLVQSRAGRRARRSGDGDRRRAQMGVPLRAGSFQGTAQAFQSSLSSRALSDRGRADHRLHHPGHPVRELHPAADDPVHAAFGRRRRAADADAVRLPISR